MTDGTTESHGSAVTGGWRTLLRSRTPELPIIAVVLVAALLTGLGYVLGLQHEQPEWHEGEAYVMPERASLRTPDWDYAVSEGVMWFDERGALHDSEWPSCLEAPPQTHTTPEKVRFAAVDVEVDGLGWREVLMVDCSSR